MHSERGADDNLDYDAVRSYWDDAAAEADSASYMAHDQGLPRDCIEHRFALEQAVIDRWFATLGPTAAVLDIGCGAGAWTELFAQRYAHVVGVDASAGMLAAARLRLAGHDNVELVHGNALTAPLQGEFDGVLLGGLLMYLDRADAGVLLERLGRLAPNGRIILRESGVRSGVEVRTGDYQVVYRSVQEYRAIAADAGLRVVSVERNKGYAHMEVSPSHSPRCCDACRRSLAVKHPQPADRCGESCEPLHPSASSCSPRPSKPSASSGPS